MNLSIKECPSYKDETFLLLQQQYEHELSPFTGNKTHNIGLYDAEEIK